MNIFRSNKDKLISSIRKDNLLLLEDGEYDCKYTLQKLYDWQEDYEDWVEWNEFKDSWFYCDRCGGYSEGSCICYAR